MKKEKVKLKVFIPSIYEYYMEISKKLTEYMIDDIGQNFNFDENDYLFNFHFLEICNAENFKMYNKSCIVFATENDLFYGKT